MTILSAGRGLAGILCLAAIVQSGCATTQSQTSGTDQTRVTKRDKTAKGAGIGAAAGAAIAALTGENKADRILAGAALGAGIGAGVGAYMDKQEEKLGHIPGTTVERIDEATQVLLEYPKTAIVVQGHTDSTGTEVHNQELSERRAHAVSAYLTGKGVDAARMATVGYGEGQPVASNDTTSGRAQNRRVDLLLKAKAK